MPNRSAHVEDNRPPVFTHETLIPISLLGGLLGMAYWVATISAVANGAASDAQYIRDQRSAALVTWTAKMDQQQKEIADIRVIVGTIQERTDTLIQMARTQARK